MNNGRRLHGGAIVALLVQGALAGCPVALPENGAVGFHCTDSDDCGLGLICANERCVAPFTVDASQIVDARADTAAASDRATADQVAGDATASDRGSVDGTVADAGVHDALAADQAADHPLLDQGAADTHASDGNIEDASGADLAIEDATATDQASSDTGAEDQVVVDALISDLAAPDLAPIDPCTLASATAIHAASALAIDGLVNDWTRACTMTIDTTADWGPDWAPHLADFDTFSADLAVQWQADALYFWFEVRDDVQWNDKDAEMIWNDDCVQVALDLDCNGGDGYSAGDFEFGWALTGGGERGYRWYPDPASATFSHFVRRQSSAGRTYYEARLTSAELDGRTFGAGSSICVSLLVNEADSGDRTGYLEWASGVADGGKFPRLFRPVLLAP